MLEQAMTLSNQRTAQQEKPKPAHPAKEKAHAGQNFTPLRRIGEYVRFAITGHPTTAMQLEDLNGQLGKLQQRQDEMAFFSSMGHDSRDNLVESDIKKQIADVRAQISKLQKG